MTEDSQADLPKRQSEMPFILAFVVFTGLSVGLGWVLANQLTGGGDHEHAKQMADVAEKKEIRKEGEAEEGEEISVNRVIRLDPIVVDLPRNDNLWIRLEIAFALAGATEIDEVSSRVRLGSEIVAYLRTLSLDQINSPMGYLHFKEDLLDRARVSTDNGVTDVYILSMIVE